MGTLHVASYTSSYKFSVLYCKHELAFIEPHVSQVLLKPIMFRKVTKPSSNNCKCEQNYSSSLQLWRRNFFSKFGHGCTNQVQEHDSSSSMYNKFNCLDDSMCLICSKKHVRSNWYPHTMPLNPHPREVNTQGLN